VTEEAALASIASDPRLRTDEERCEAARATLTHAHRLVEADLPVVCRAASTS